MTSTGTSSINSQTRDERVILERNGRQVELSTRQVTAENIRKMFQVHCLYPINYSYYADHYFIEQSR